MYLILLVIYHRSYLPKMIVTWSLEYLGCSEWSRYIYHISLLETQGNLLVFVYFEEQMAKQLKSVMKFVSPDLRTRKRNSSEDKRRRWI